VIFLGELLYDLNALCHRLHGIRKPDPAMP
jgi:hypothetical protein